MWQMRFRAVSLAILTFLLGFALSQSVKFPQPQVETLKATVVRVIDGDAIEVKIPGETKTVKVRIIGYDAPELTSSKSVFVFAKFCELKSYQTAYQLANIEHATVQGLQ